MERVNDPDQCSDRKRTNGCPRGDVDLAMVRPLAKLVSTERPGLRTYLCNYWTEPSSCARSVGWNRRVDRVNLGSRNVSSFGFDLVGFGG